MSANNSGKIRHQDAHSSNNDEQMKISAKSSAGSAASRSYDCDGQLTAADGQIDHHCQLETAPTAAAAQNHTKQQLEPTARRRKIGTASPTLIVETQRQHATRVNNRLPREVCAFRAQSSSERQEAEDTISVATSTSDVNSNDDAASIASRLSRIALDEEVKLSTSPTPSCAKQEGYGDEADGEISIRRAGEQQGGNHRQRDELGASHCADWSCDWPPPPPLPQQQQPSLRPSEAAEAHDGGITGAKLTRAQPQVDQRSAVGGLPAIKVSDNCGDGGQCEAFGAAIHSGRARTKSMATMRVKSGANDDEQQQQQGVTAAAQSGGPSKGMRRNESLGNFRPERGDLRSLEESRQAAAVAAALARQSNGSATPPYGASSEQTRLRSNTSGNLGLGLGLGGSDGGGGGGGGGGFGAPMLNICRSAWTLSDFDQTFNKDATDLMDALPPNTTEMPLDSPQMTTSGSGSRWGRRNSSGDPPTESGGADFQQVAGSQSGASSSKLLIRASMKNAYNSHLSASSPLQPLNGSTAPMTSSQALDWDHPKSTGHQPMAASRNGSESHLSAGDSLGGRRHSRAHSICSFASSVNSFYDIGKPLGGRLASFWSPGSQAKDCECGGGTSPSPPNSKCDLYAAERHKHNRKATATAGGCGCGGHGRCAARAAAAPSSSSSSCCGCCSSCCNWASAKQLLPILDWLPNYSLQSLWGDITAGLAVAVLNISISLSAALVAETELGAAFRSSIVSTLVYALLSSSRHVSFGSWSIMSQMLLVSVRRALSDELILNRINLGPAASWEREEYEMWHMNIIVMYTFLIGLVQFLSGLLSLGNILASFIPEALCSSLITATAFTMAIGQLANMCGTTNKLLWQLERNTTELWADLKNPPLDITDLFAGTFRWIQQVALLVKHNQQINTTCVIISISAILIYTLNSVLLQGRLLRKLAGNRNIFFPIELVLLVTMIIISYWLNLSGDPYRVATCGPIHIDFVAPNLPNFRLFRELWYDSLATALISYTMVFIMARTYSNKLNYEVDCNQELIACGAGNLIGGLVEALPATASFSRTAGQVEAGGQTQMASIINCFILLLMVKLLGHHVAVLPTCVMSATLFYGFIRMMGRFTDVFEYWRICKVDFAIWMVTFVAILALDMVSGFVYGFIFSILTMLYRAQNRRCYLLGSIGPSSDVFVPLAKYPKAARELDHIKIFQFCGPIHYVCADLFERLLRQKTRVNVKQVLKETTGNAAVVASRPNNQGTKLEPNGGEQQVEVNPIDLNLPTHIILDFSMISYIDSAGIHVIRKIIQDYQRINITILLASLASHVATVVKSEPSLWEVYKERFYVTLADAVHFAIRDSQLVVVQHTSHCQHQTTAPDSPATWHATINCRQLHLVDSL